MVAQLLRKTADHKGDTHQVPAATSAAIAEVEVSTAATTEMAEAEDEDSAATITEEATEAPATTQTKTTKASTVKRSLIAGVIFTFIIGLVASAFLKKEENPISNTA